MTFLRHSTSANFQITEEPTYHNYSSQKSTPKPILCPGTVLAFLTQSKPYTRHHPGGERTFVPHCPRESGVPVKDVAVTNLG